MAFSVKDNTGGNAYPNRNYGIPDGYSKNANTFRAFIPLLQDITIAEGNVVDPIDTIFPIGRVRPDDIIYSILMQYHSVGGTGNYKIGLFKSKKSGGSLADDVDYSDDSLSDLFAPSRPVTATELFETELYYGLGGTRLNLPIWAVIQLFNSEPIDWEAADRDAEYIMTITSLDTGISTEAGVAVLASVLR